MRVWVLGLAAFGGGCSTVDRSPKPPPPWLTPAGVEVTIRDSRAAVAQETDEKPAKYKALQAALNQAFDDGPGRPRTAEVVVESYRWKTREPGESDGIVRPGDHILGPATTNTNNPLANASGLVSGIVSAGLMEAAQTQKEKADPVAAAVERGQERLEIGANVWLRSKVTIAWPGGQTRTFTVVTRGFADCADGQRYWGDALNSAAEHAAANLGGEVRKAAQQEMVSPTP